MTGAGLHTRPTAAHTVLMRTRDNSCFITTKLTELNVAEEPVGGGGGTEDWSTVVSLHHMGN